MAFIPNIQGIRITGSLTGITSIQSSTISATTYQNVPAVTGGSYSNGTITLSGTGGVNGNQITGLSALTPITLYSGNGSLSGNRIVDIDGFSLNFSGSTATNNLFVSGGSVSIGTTSIPSSSIFTLSSTSKGFLGPRMTEAQRLAIPSTATGLVVYQTDGDEGYYIYKSFGWVQII